MCPGWFGATFLTSHYLVFFFQFLSSLFFFVTLFIFDFARSLLLCELFSSCSERGLLFFAVCGLLTAVASLVPDHRL